MPIQYTGIIDEHRAVREKVGLFDVSHMGEIVVKGRDALAFLQRVLTTDVSKGYQGRVLYSPMCNSDGGVIDDMTVYCLGDGEYMLVVNASRTQADMEWLMSQASCGFEASVEDRSREFGEVAVQGPLAVELIGRLMPEATGLRYYHFGWFKLAGQQLLVSRTGYTGEDGFEIYCGWEFTPQLWEMLMAAGADLGVVPCGLGCRDTLRLEAGMPLYGHELDENHTPIEAGLGRFVALDKGEFVGAERLREQATRGPEVRLCGLIMAEPGIPRSGYRVVAGSEEAGVVTSGSYSPTLEKPIAMAYLKSKYCVPGTQVAVDIRGKLRLAGVVPLPFYKRKK